MCNEFLMKINDKIPELKLQFPTEAQWEWACRAGTVTPFSFRDTITTEQVNYTGKSSWNGNVKGINRKSTVPVKSLPPNYWGLYEMHGNLWEWCEDWFDEDYYQECVTTNPLNVVKSDLRVLRGGSWHNESGSCRSAIRDRDFPESLSKIFGFRFARGC